MGDREDTISLVDHLVLVSSGRCYSRRTHYPTLEKPVAQNLAAREK